MSLKILIQSATATAATAAMYRPMKREIEKKQWTKCCGVNIIGVCATFKNSIAKKTKSKIDSFSHII